MSKEEIRTLKNVKEYQEAINQVRETKQPIKVRFDFEITEEELNSLDMSGTDVEFYDEYEEIKSLE